MSSTKRRIGAERCNWWQEGCRLRFCTRAHSANAPVRCEKAGCGYGDELVFGASHLGRRCLEGHICARECPAASCQKGKDCNFAHKSTTLDNCRFQVRCNDSCCPLYHPKWCEKTREACDKPDCRNAHLRPSVFSAPSPRKGREESEDPERAGSPQKKQEEAAEETTLRPRERSPQKLSPPVTEWWGPVPVPQPLKPAWGRAAAASPLKRIDEGWGYDPRCWEGRPRRASSSDEESDPIDAAIARLRGNLIKGALPIGLK